MCMLGVWDVLCFVRVGRCGLFGVVNTRLVFCGIGVGCICVCVVLA